MTITSAPNGLDERGLPTWCPSWCDGAHAQSLEDGCPPEDARVHQGPDHGLQSSRDPLTGWTLTIRQDAGIPITPAWIELEAYVQNAVDRRTEVTLHLSTGAARVLAAQLLHLADLDDLD